MCLYNTRMLLDVRERIMALEKSQKTSNLLLPQPASNFKFTIMATEEHYNEFCKKLQTDGYKAEMVRTCL